MRQVVEALDSFFNQFGVPAYGNDSVPDGARMPYITYEVVIPPPMEAVRLRAWAWTNWCTLQEPLEVAGRVWIKAGPGGFAETYKNDDGSEGALVFVPGEIREVGGVDERCRCLEMTFEVVRC